jgi:hypothetical protein
MEPDIVPAPESPGCIAVMAGEFFGEIRGSELYLGLGDAFDAEVLDEDVRSKQHKAAHAVVNTSVDQCDRGTVAVADENRCFKVELGEEFGESRFWKPFRQSATYRSAPFSDTFKQWCSGSVVMAIKRTI